MNPPQEDNPPNAVKVASFVVVNFIYWMVLLAAIGFGALYIGHCPLQPNIPIYLVVLGASNIIALTISYIMPACGHTLIGLLTRSIGGLIYIFLFCWFIAGTHWIYSIYPPSYTPGTSRYCHKTPYLFAFIVTTLQWSAVGIVLIFAGCFMLLTCCIGINTRNSIIPHRSSFYGTTNNFHESIVGDA
ncbi:unnamed protein product [Ophioblennius macclurei]